MILLSAASEIILFFSGAKNNHLNNKTQQDYRKGSSFSGVVHTGTWKVHGGPGKVSGVVL